MNQDPANPPASTIEVVSPAIEEPEFFTIKQAAERLNISTGTIRYYLRIGLVPHIKRAKNGYRILDASQLDLLKTFVYLHRSGSNTREIKRFAHLIRQGKSSLPERKAILETIRQQLWQQLDDTRENIDFIERQIELFDQKTTPKSA